MNNQTDRIKKQEIRLLTSLACFILAFAQSLAEQLIYGFPQLLAQPRTFWNTPTAHTAQPAQPTI